jgi:pimeloyl-ACP methyl ester carboxylesterase
MKILYKYLMKKIIVIILCIIIISCVHRKTNIGEIMKTNISEKIYVNINGLEQGMFIKGHKNNPIILFLHGGPGMPEYPLTQKYETTIEEHFTVCWWEQRGASLSYNKNINFNEITIEQLVLDTIEMTNYLRNRFGQEKIYLMGHSFGTLIGLKTVKQRPELYYAYIGMAQITNQLDSEKIAYNYIMEHYTNKNIIKKMKKYNIPAMDTMPLEYVALRDKPMHELGIGTMHDMKSVISGIFFPIMNFSEYTFSEKINLWKAKSLLLNRTNLWETMIATDFSKEILSIDIPIYFIHGIYDYTVNYSLTKEYYKILQAPIKGFYTFNQSAHSPIFEEPDKFIEILMEDVIKGKNELSDNII